MFVVNQTNQVGSQPTRGELARAMADMLFVGLEGYHAKYNALAAAVDGAVGKIAAAGMTIIHGEHRARGSTAFSVEDPSAAVGRMVKKRGHAPSLVFTINRDAPARCQTGFLMSLTPHALREVRPLAAAARAKEANVPIQRSFRRALRHRVEPWPSRSLRSAPLPGTETGEGEARAQT